MISFFLPAAAWTLRRPACGVRALSARPGGEPNPCRWSGARGARRGDGGGERQAPASDGATKAARRALAGLEPTPRRDCSEKAIVGVTRAAGGRAGGGQARCWIGLRQCGARGESRRLCVAGSLPSRSTFGGKGMRGEHAEGAHGAWPGLAWQPAGPGGQGGLGARRCGAAPRQPSPPWRLLGGGWLAAGAHVCTQRRCRALPSCLPGRARHSFPSQTARACHVPLPAGGGAKQAGLTH
jgi:hypothetical protein